MLIEATCFFKLTAFRLDRRLKQGQLTVIRAALFGTNPVNADPGLKVNRTINFSRIKMFFTASVLCSLRLFKLRRSNNISRKPHQQVKKKTLKSTILCLLNQALNNLAWLNLDYNYTQHQVKQSNLRGYQNTLTQEITVNRHFSNR